MASQKDINDKANIALIGALIALLRKPKICCDSAGSLTDSPSDGPLGPFAGPNLFIATPASGPGFGLYRLIEQSDLSNAQAMLLNVSQTITAQKIYPTAGAQAMVLPAFRQAAGGFDITVPSPAAPDNMALQSYVNTRAPSGTGIGDIQYWNGSAWVMLSATTSGRLLQTNGAGTAPSYASNINAGGTLTGTIVTASTRVDTPTVGTGSGAQHALPADTSALLSVTSTATPINKSIDGNTNTLTNMPGSGGPFTAFSNLAGFTGTLYARVGRHDLNASPINGFSGRSYKATAMSILVPAGVQAGGTIDVEYVEASSMSAVPVSLATPWTMSLTAGQTSIHDTLFPGRQLVSPTVRYTNLKITISGGAGYTGDIYVQWSANA